RDKLVTGVQTCALPISFGLDGRSDDNLRLLKFRDIASTDIAHTSRDRADQILTAIINFRWAEKDLFQRAGSANFDARSAWKISMRGGHPPMVAAARRLLRLGKGAAHHDGVRAARQGFANVTS